jgi:predicted AlkP superfamily phosphohydrolase/phosphomutase
LVVGLDAGDGDLALELAAEGRLPNLAALAASGAKVFFDQPGGASYIGSIWPTLATGCRPERHRYVSWAAVDPNTYGVVELGPDHIACPPFWSQLAERSQRVAVIDVPRFAASGALGDESVELFGWATHDNTEGPRSWPPERLADAEASVDRPDFGRPRADHPAHFAPCDWTHGGPDRPRSTEQLVSLRDAILASVDSKIEVSRQYLDGGDWDLFFTVAAEPHCAGHHFWDQHAGAYADGTASPTDIGDPLVEVYERIDTGLGWLVDAAGSDATIVVVFSHGMTANAARSEVLDLVLDRIARAGAQRGTTSGVAAAKSVWRRVPRSLRRRLHSTVARIVRRAARRRTLDPDPPIADRSRRRYAAAPGAAAVSGVRLNQIGRDAQGLVPAADRAATLELVTDHLLDLVDVETGRSAVQRVVNADDVAGGFPDDGLPDLLVEWDDRGRGNTLYSPGLGLLPFPSTTVRTGDHRAGGGLLIAHGPGVAPITLTGIAPEDIAPTIAALCGVLLRDVDGQPVHELVNERALASESARR